MAAPRRLREIDQSTQRFHVGCYNRCLLGNEYGRLHGREFLGRTLMILILTNQSDAMTQNAWFLCTLFAAISGEISILIQTGQSLGEGFLYQESAIGRVDKMQLMSKLCEIFRYNKIVVDTTSEECFKKLRHCEEQMKHKTVLYVVFILLYFLLIYLRYLR